MTRWGSPGSSSEPVTQDAVAYAHERIERPPTHRDARRSRWITDVATPGRQTIQKSSTVSGRVHD